MFVEDLIPNHALNKAAEWFNRQKISKMASEDIEIDPLQNTDKLSDIGKQLLTETLEEVAKRDKEGDEREADGSQPGGEGGMQDQNMSQNGANSTSETNQLKRMGD